MNNGNKWNKNNNRLLHRAFSNNNNLLLFNHHLHPYNRFNNSHPLFRSLRLHNRSFNNNNNNNNNNNHHHHHHLNNKINNRCPQAPLSNLIRFSPKSHSSLVPSHSS